MLIGARTAAWGGRLPYDRRVMFIQSSGTQWIDTGLNADNNLVCYFNMAFPERSPVFVGAIRQIGSAYVRHHFALSDGDNIVKYWMGSLSSSSLVFARQTFCDVVANPKNGIFKVGNSQTKLDVTSFDCNLNYHLFARPFATSTISVSGFEMSLSYCEMTHNADIRTFIPVVKKINGNDTAFLFDAANEEAYYNEGTGSFGWMELDGTTYHAPTS